MAARKTKTTRKSTQYVRSKKRKGKEPSEWARRSVTIVLLLLVLVGVVYGFMQGFEWMGRKLLSENPLFEIQHLEISCDGNLGEDFIRETTGLHEGMNLFAFDFRDLEESLKSVSRIESVYLERDLPHTLIVKVKERVPVAQITGTNTSRYPYLVDRFGYLLPHLRSAANLPLIKGVDEELRLGTKASHHDVENALKIIAFCESSNYLHTYIRIESMDVKYSDFIDMRLQGGIRVRMPRFSFKTKLQKLASIIKISIGQGQRVREVDLTLDSPKVPVTYY